MFRYVTIQLVFLTMATAANALTYDARTDFSTTQNPNGVWAYGWSADLTGPLHVYADFRTENNGGYHWTDKSIEDSDAPHVSYYPLDVPWQYVPPHSMLIHPGPLKQFSHCVWTAPEAGIYDIQASFTAVDFGGPHAYLLKNHAIIADYLLATHKPENFSSKSVSLAAGDTIDVALGVGRSNTYYNDTTQFSLTIYKESIEQEAVKAKPSHQLQNGHLFNSLAPAPSRHLSLQQ